MTTTDIIAAIRVNSADKALRYLYKTALPPIVSFIRQKRGTSSDAEDCFQEAMMVFIKKVKTNGYNESYEIQNFLFVVARNIWFNRLKRNGLFVNEAVDESYLQDESVTAEDVLLQRERLDALGKLFSDVGEKCKQLLHLVLHEGKKLAEVQKIMGFKSEGVVKTTHFRCKEKLKQLLRDNNELREHLRH